MKLRTLSHLSAPLCVGLFISIASQIACAAAPNLAGQIAQASIFPEGFAWVKPSAPAEGESTALIDALRQIKRQTDAASQDFVYQTNGTTITKWPKRTEPDVAPLVRFVEAYPDSGWASSIHAKLGKFYRDHGRYSLALRHWETAWDATKKLQGAGKDVADFTFAHWTSLLASLGRLDKLKALYAETESRVFDGGALQQMINATREGMQSMQATPGSSFQCGTYALAELARIFKSTNETALKLLSVPSPTSGFTMERLLELSREANLDLVAVKRPAGAPIPVPSVVHWREDHYAAVVAEHAGYYRVTDPTFGGASWLSRDAIDAEASGAFLVPRASKPAEWQPVSHLETCQIHGQGAPNYIGDTNDQHACKLAGYNGDLCFLDCKHMARWWVSEPYITLWVEDEPIGYQPSRGERLAFHLSFKQRDARPEDTNIFSFGKLWEASWLSRISLQNLLTGQSCGGNGCVGIAAYDATLYLAGGGSSFFSETNATGDISGQQPNRINQTRMGPIFDGLNLTGFKVTYADSSYDEYKYLIGNPVTDALLTSRFDAAGNNTARFTYVQTNGVHRLTQVTDVDNRNCTLLYTNATFPYLVTEVDDPFSRKAYLKHNSSGQLTNITDPASLNSGIAYDGQGFVTTLTTPYGATTFTATGGTTNYMGGNTVNRSLKILDPNGGTQLYLYRDSSTNLLPSAYSGQYIFNGLPFGTPYNSLENSFLQYRNSFYWDAKQYANLSTTTVTALSSNDFLKGRLHHWLHVAGASPLRVSSTLSVERQPAADGASIGQVIWYDYPGKPSGNNNAEGTNSLPSVIAWALPISGRHFVWTIRNTVGAPTSIVESYSGGLRTNTFVYATNGIDLVLHFGPSNELLESYAYNDKHQPTYFTNALGEVTHFIYNAQNQVQEIDYPTGLVQNNVYYGVGNPYQYWLNYFYDSLHNHTTFTYSNGLVRTITDARGLGTTYTWDNLQRPTGIGFPDTTYSSNIYNNLDLVGSKDRLGNWTRFKYNPNRQLTTVSNALNAYTSFLWCNCGALDSMTDVSNKITQFFYDLNSRKLLTIFRDGTTVSNIYNRLGQLERTRDAAGNWATNIFNEQGLLTAVNGSFGQMLGLAYDKRDRMTQTTDANGITVTSTFDNLNRLLTRSYPTGAAEIFGFSTNGLAVYTNQLSQPTTYGRDGAGRLTSLTNANQEVTRLTYNLGGDLVSVEDGNHHFNRWLYDVYGNLTAETNGLGNRTLALSYDANNRRTNRTDALGQQTGYAFDGVGNLTNLVSSTMTNTFVFDGLNRVVTVTDAVGTGRFTYTTIGQLLTEDGPWSNDTITNSYVGQLRTDFSLQMPSGPTWTNRSSYDAEQRLQSLTSPAGTFSYQYPPSGSTLAQASLLPQKISLPGGSYITNDYDALTRLKSTVLKTSGDFVLDSRTYRVDGGGQRTNVFRTDNVGIRYQYDQIGQLTNVSPIKITRPHETFSYGYDAADNLIYRTKDLFAQTFNPDAANQLSTLTRSNTYTVAGLVTTSACAVAINGNAAVLYSDNTFSLGGFSLFDGTNIFSAIAQDVLGRRDTNTITLFAPLTATLTYDLNENLRYDGSRAFDYDEDNRLIRVTVTNVFKAEWLYDGLGRRRIRRDYSWQGAWAKINEVRFIFDGNLVVQERDTNNVVLATYTRGIDFAGTREAGGGIGGLLAFTQNQTTNHAFYHADSSGNITALVSTGQVVVATYLYAPFGGLIAWSGSVADANRYRFSSKEYYGTAGLILYERRAYDPNLQRWLSHDPMGIRTGEVNAHRFAGNGPLNRLDMDGRKWVLFDWGAWRQLIRDTFVGDSSSGGYDPNSNIMLRTDDGTGIDPIRDKNGDIIRPSDALIDVVAEIPKAGVETAMVLGTGGAGEIPEALEAANALKKCEEAASLAKAAKAMSKAESSAANKIKNILTRNFKPGPKGDISGAIHDMVGNPIPKPGGGTYDHTQDLGNILRGLRNNADALKNATDPAATAVREQALQAIQQIETAIRGTGL